MVHGHQLTFVWERCLCTKITPTALDGAGEPKTMSPSNGADAPMSGNLRKMVHVHQLTFVLERCSCTEIGQIARYGAGKPK
jgi:hypothetical protein